MVSTGWGLGCITAQAALPATLVLLSFLTCHTTSDVTPCCKSMLPAACHGVKLACMNQMRLKAACIPVCSLPKHEPGYPGGIFAPFIPGETF